MIIIFAERVSPGAHGDDHLNTPHIRATYSQPYIFVIIAMRVICIPAGNRSTRLHIDDWPVDNGGISLVNHTVSRLRRQKSSSCVRW